MLTEIGNTFSAQDSWGPQEILVFTEHVFYIKKICIEEFVVVFVCKDY